MELVPGAGGSVGEASIESEAGPVVRESGPPVQVLLALWGRPHEPVEVVDGDPQVWAGWQQLPGRAFQLGVVVGDLASDEQTDIAVDFARQLGVTSNVAKSDWTSPIHYDVMPVDG